MIENPFNRLSPFIQEYIYNDGWTELRNVQVAACDVIFNTNKHLLITAGTASGKTEAAFLPILTLLTENPPSSIGVLYICPLKALINDQFYRLENLLKETNIPVCHWHGDVSQGEKNKFLKDPGGVLQITPESLESLLINKTTHLNRLFKDLRFIVIDEVHVFMNSDRGLQVLCQLHRLLNYTKNPPRRVGLSATLGDYKQAEDWLKSGTGVDVITPKINSGNQKIRLAVEHFNSSSNDEKKEKEQKDSSDPYYQYMFDNSLNKKCIIFSNDRQTAEDVILNLRQISSKLNYPDIYHVHHGSISKEYRETAELAMKKENEISVTAATVTLELGIDIGNLDRVLQINSPYSVASFLQRLGRSGRRNKISELWMITKEEKGNSEDFYELIPWDLLQSIAIIQLYIEEKWIEPISETKYPFGLLYHQTMSILATYCDLSPRHLASKVLTLPCFKYISQDDYKKFLIHLLQINHLQKTEEGNLIIGLEGEKIVRNFRFYAVFQDVIEFIVKDGTKTIGKLDYFVDAGTVFSLAGKTWKVIDADLKRKMVFVTKVKGKSKSSWKSNGGNIHTKILQRMKKVLIEDCNYPYLQKKALNKLKEARKLANEVDLVNNNIFKLGPNTYCLMPWAGSKSFDTLRRALLNYYDEGQLLSIRPYKSYYMVITLKEKNKPISEDFINYIKEKVKVTDLVDINEYLEISKYDKFVPVELLFKAFCEDQLDIDGVLDLELLKQ